jgi:hypothetical protein
VAIDGCTSQPTSGRRSSRARREQALVQSGLAVGRDLWEPPVLELEDVRRSEDGGVRRRAAGWPVGRFVVAAAGGRVPLLDCAR